VQIADLYPSNNGFGDPEKTTKENTEKIEDSISITEDSISAVEDSISATEDSSNSIMDLSDFTQENTVEAQVNTMAQTENTEATNKATEKTAGLIGRIGGWMSEQKAAMSTTQKTAIGATTAVSRTLGLATTLGVMGYNALTDDDKPIEPTTFGFQEQDSYENPGRSAASGGSNADNEAAGSAGEFGSFASGGFHKGGWRMVGERGPELEFTPPSRIFSNTDSKGMMSGQSAQIDTLISASISMINSLKTLNKRIDKWDKIGMPAVRA